MTLEELVREQEFSFEGARRGHQMGRGDFALCHQAGASWAEESGEPLQACVTKACAAYWDLCDTQSKPERTRACPKPEKRKRGR